MSQAVLTSKAKIVPQQKINSINTYELTSETEQHKREICDNIIKENLGGAMISPNKLPPSVFIPYSDGDLYPPALNEVDEYPVQSYGTAVFEHLIRYHWIHAKLNLPQGEEIKKVKVGSQSKDEDGHIIGKYDRNPMLNTMVYDVEFPGGAICEYGANVIVEIIYS